MYNQAAIYIIQNIKTKKVYVGSASYLKRRWKKHIRELDQNNHENSYLQNAWNKYGKDCFEFKIIEICDKTKLLEKEQFWLDYYKSYLSLNGYNICSKARSPFGIKRSKAFREKMRLLNPDLGKKRLGCKNTLQHNQRISQARKGIVFSDKHRLNLRLSHLGQFPSIQTLQKRSKALRGKIPWNKGLRKVKEKKVKSILQNFDIHDSVRNIEK